MECSTQGGRDDQRPLWLQRELNIDRAAASLEAAVITESRSSGSAHEDWRGGTAARNGCKQIQRRKAQQKGVAWLILEFLFR
jgi:hypothetical protein